MSWWPLVAHGLACLVQAYAMWKVERGQSLASQLLLAAAVVLGLSGVGAAIRGVG